MGGALALNALGRGELLGPLRPWRVRLDDFLVFLEFPDDFMVPPLSVLAISVQFKIDHGAGTIFILFRLGRARTAFRCLRRRSASRSARSFPASAKGKGIVEPIGWRSRGG